MRQVTGADGRLLELRHGMLIKCAWGQNGTVPWIAPSTGSCIIYTVALVGKTVEHQATERGCMQSRDITAHEGHIPCGCSRLAVR